MSNHFDDVDNGDMKKVVEHARLLRSQKKYASRRFTPDVAPELLQNSGVDPDLWPTKRQYAQWFPYVIKSLPPDPFGSWYAVCPLLNNGSPAGKIRKPSAIFDFSAGVMRCLHDEPCHGAQRAISLWNLQPQVFAKLTDS